MGEAKPSGAAQGAATGGATTAPAEAADSVIIAYPLP
jgi:hypothetical protein